MHAHIPERTINGAAQGVRVLSAEKSAALVLRQRQRERRMRAEQRAAQSRAEAHKHMLARTTKAMQVAEQNINASLAAIMHDDEAT